MASSFPSLDYQKQDFSFIALFLQSTTLPGLSVKFGGAAGWAIPKANCQRGFQQELKPVRGRGRSQ